MADVLHFAGKDVHIKITPSHISCFIHGEKVFDGDLCHSILVDESTWSVEDKKFVRILLAKALRKEGDPLYFVFMSLNWFYYVARVQNCKCSLRVDMQFWKVSDKHGFIRGSMSE